MPRIHRASRRWCWNARLGRRYPKCEDIATHCSRWYRSYSGRWAGAAAGVNRRLRAERNQLRVSDFTYVSTWQGWLHVTFVIDVFARRIVSASVRRHHIKICNKGNKDACPAEGDAAYAPMCAASLGFQRCGKKPLKGSTLFSLADCTRLITTAAPSPASSLPTKS